MKKEYLKAVKEHRAYDYIANHYWEMSKYELRECCLEALYQLTDEQDEYMVNEIENTYEFDEEDE